MDHLEDPTFTRADCLSRSLQVASGLGLEAASQFGGTPESVKEQYRKMGAIELEESGAAVAYVIDNAGIDSCNGTQISASDTLKNKDMVFFGW